MQTYLFWYLKEKWLTFQIKVGPTRPQTLGTLFWLTCMHQWMTQKSYYYYPYLLLLGKVICVQSLLWSWFLYGPHPIIKSLTTTALNTHLSLTPLTFLSIIQIGRFHVCMYISLSFNIVTQRFYQSLYHKFRYPNNTTTSF